ncbi:MAG: hypothetical protein KR126chlam1_00586 [Chlamydiae bacterium]|nr:hypothetical protein [Chlamydiota bacterium]
MSSEVSSRVFAGFISEIQEETEKYLPESSETVEFMIGSSAMVQASLATVKSLSYVFLNKEFGVNDIKAFFSSRLLYVETALISFSCMIHNFVMALIYSGVLLVTSGLSQSLNRSCRRHWSHFGYGVAAFGIAVLGVVSPYLGVGVYYQVMRSSLYSFKRSYWSDVNRFEKVLIGSVQKTIDKRLEDLKKYFKTFKEDRYQNVFEPSLDHIKLRVDRLKTMDNLLELIGDIWKKFPHMGKAEQTLQPLDESILSSSARHDHHDRTPT